MDIFKTVCNRKLNMKHLISLEMYRITLPLAEFCSMVCWPRRKAVLRFKPPKGHCKAILAFVYSTLFWKITNWIRYMDAKKKKKKSLDWLSHNSKGRTVYFHIYPTCDLLFEHLTWSQYGAAGETTHFVSFNPTIEAYMKSQMKTEKTFCTCIFYVTLVWVFPSLGDYQTVFVTDMPYDLFNLISSTCLDYLNFCT